jgi:hypothetical protein
MSLLGLLGTVTGMIDAFGTLSANGGYATVTELSGNVYKACSPPPPDRRATPTFVPTVTFRRGSIRLCTKWSALEVVHMLSDREPKGDIITFQAPSAEREAR